MVVSETAWAAVQDQLPGQAQVLPHVGWGGRLGGRAHTRHECRSSMCIEKPCNTLDAGYHACVGVCITVLLHWVGSGLTAALYEFFMRGTSLRYHSLTPALIASRLTQLLY